MPHNGIRSTSENRQKKAETSEKTESLEDLKNKQKEYQNDIKTGKKKRPSFDSEDTKNYAQKNKERTVEKKKQEREIETLERELLEKKRKRNAGIPIATPDYTDDEFEKETNRLNKAVEERKKEIENLEKEDIKHWLKWIDNAQD